MKSESSQNPYDTVRKPSTASTAIYGVFVLVIIILVLLLYGFMSPKGCSEKAITVEELQSTLLERDKTIKNLRSTLSKKESSLAQCRREDTKCNRQLKQQEETELKQVQFQCRQPKIVPKLPVSTVSKKVKHFDSDSLEKVKREKYPQLTTKQQGIKQREQKIKKKGNVVTDKKTNHRRN